MKKLMKIFAMLVVSAFVCDSLKAEEEVFSGVYKESYQLIPNTMATHCKTSAEDMVKDPQKLRNCINTLALKRRSSNAEIAREGLKDLNEIKADELQEMMSLAVAKGAAVAGYYLKQSEEVAEVNANAKTVNDVDGAAINTNAVLTSVVNSFRDLYVEQLKYLAISNIENISKDVLTEVASISELQDAQDRDNQAAENSESSAGSTGGAEAEVVNTIVAEEYVLTDKWQFVGDGQCRFCVKREDNKPECRNEVCPDGEYADPNDNNVGWKCKNKECVKVSVSENSSPQNVSGDISFNNVNGIGWQLIDARTCEYCNYGEKNGATVLNCERRNCPDGTFAHASDDSIMISCSNGECEEIDK